MGVVVLHHRLGLVKNGHVVVALDFALRELYFGARLTLAIVIPGT